MASQAKTFKLVSVDPERRGTPTPVDWSLCFLCQESGEGLGEIRCPADDNNVNSRLETYDGLLDMLHSFSASDLLPRYLQNILSQDVTGPILLENQAQWHKNCRLKYTKSKLLRGQKRRSSSESPYPSRITDSATPSTSQQTSRTSFPMGADVCFICEKEGTNLCHASTMQLDAKVRRWAVEQGNRNLIAKLSAGDMIALDAKYHKNCITDLHNKSRIVQWESGDTESLELCESIAYAELVSDIEDVLQSSTDIPVFKMSELTKGLKKRLTGIISGIDTRPLEVPEVHTTRLRNRLEFDFPLLESRKYGREYLFLPKSNVGDAVHTACLAADNPDKEARALLNVSKKLRKEINKKAQGFSGSFSTNAQAKSVPVLLLALVNMILYGQSVPVEESPQAALTISQLIMFNMRQGKPQSEINRHRKDLETPLPVYLGMAVHGKTRNKSLIENIHSLGLSISYTRVLEISSALCEVQSRQYQAENCVCPVTLKADLFTIAAYDNVDHNPSSNTSEGSFHGTSISLFQTATNEIPGVSRSLRTDSELFRSKSCKVPELPDSFTVVRPAYLPATSANVPATTEDVSKQMAPDDDTMSDEMKKESNWLKHINSTCKLSSDDDDALSSLDVTWASYHATKSETPLLMKAISCLLPLFQEGSSSISMIVHGMDMIKCAVSNVNGSQVPVIAMDQPLFAKVKLIQWAWPEKYGETQFVFVFGSLHIEQAFMRVIGQWLEHSGWKGVLVQTGIYTESKVDACIKVSHIKKTAYLLQVTAASLGILLEEAFEENGEHVAFEDWCSEEAKQHPLFKYWLISLRLLKLLFTFVRSIRQRNFGLYLTSLKKMLPWFFVMDHPNYSRWLSVHVKDLVELETTAPAIYRRFLTGDFAICKTHRPFSAIGIDQAHEQNNAVVKGDGGAIGLTEDNDALRRWNIVGPLLSELINEFEVDLNKNSAHVNPKHHEQYRSFQTKFLKKVQSVRDSFNEFGNPFSDDSSELFVLDSKVVVQADIVEKMNGAESTGLECYNKFRGERFVQRSKPLDAAITRTNLPLFASKKKRRTKADGHIRILKLDVELFSRLFIVSQNRQLDLDTFFQYENQPFPPALSTDGDLYLGQKADLLGLLENVPDNADNTASNRVTCDGLIIDGAALVNILQPGKELKTFDQYYSNTFAPHLTKQVTTVNATRLDVVWDTYLKDSLKEQTRQKRGIGVKMVVRLSGTLPRSWKDFLRNSDNKQQLFDLLASLTVERMGSTMTVVSNVHNSVHQSASVSTLPPTVKHEEADTSIFVHLTDMVTNRITKIGIRTVDTDVLVLALASFNKLYAIGLRELWLLFGTSKNYRNIPVHRIADEIGTEMCSAPPGFLAYSGCDTVSAFVGRGKKTAWQTWKAFPAVTWAFTSISTVLRSLPDDVFRDLEHFTCLMYSSRTEQTEVNMLRKEQFTIGNKRLESLPPTKEALRQHTLRAAFQSGHVWGQSCEAEPTYPCPKEWGWRETDSHWEPKWSTLDELCKSCQELVKCRCTKGCSRACSCRKAQLSCTLLCHCQGECSE